MGGSVRESVALAGLYELDSEIELANGQYTWLQGSHQVRLRMWLASTEKGWSSDRGRDPYMLIRRPKWSQGITTNTLWG
jgi:hypothetical protein